jgi:hypothetical protein
MLGPEHENYKKSKHWCIILLSVSLLCCQFLNPNLGYSSSAQGLEN